MFTLNKPQNIFLLISLFFGFLILLTNPPFQAADENLHFFRIYQLSEFKLLSDKNNDKIGTNLPTSLLTLTKKFEYLNHQSNLKTDLTTIKKCFNIALNKNEQTFIEFPSASVYAPIGYTPQIVGIWVSKLINSPPILMMYISRFFNLIAYSLSIFYAIKITPVKKWLFFLLGLMPMSIYQGSSLSIDGCTIGLSFLFIAFCLFLAYEESKSEITKRDMILFTALISCIALSKFTYILLIFLFFLVPKSKFKNNTSYYGYFSLALITSFILLFIWTQLIKDIKIPTFFGYDNTESQAKYIFSNFSNYISIVFYTLLSRANSYVVSFFGLLGWMDTRLPVFLKDLYLNSLLVIAICSVETNTVVIKAKQKILFSTITVIYVLLLLTIFFIYYTPGVAIIEGIQGRYFIPIIPLFYLLFHNNIKALQLPKLNIFAVIVPIFTLILSMISLVVRYY